MSAPAVERWTEQMVSAVLSKKFGKPEFAFLRQVRNATGLSDQVRTADALAMGLWPSRGLHLHGFEIKVSRSDWAHELKQPEKAEEIARYCHFWWLAVPDAAIVKTGELPQPWGLIEVKGGTPKVVKQAPYTENPQSPTMPFFASLMRSVAEGDAALDDIRTLMTKEIQKAQQQAREDAERFAGEQNKKLLQRVAELTEHISTFERMSGVRMDRYSEYFNGEIGAAVKMLRNERGIVTAVENAKALLESLAIDLGDVISGLRAVKPAKDQAPEQLQLDAEVSA